MAAASAAVVAEEAKAGLLGMMLRLVRDTRVGRATLGSLWTRSEVVVLSHPAHAAIVRVQGMKLEVFSQPVGVP